MPRLFLGNDATFLRSKNKIVQLFSNMTWGLATSSRTRNELEKIFLIIINMVQILSSKLIGCINFCNSMSSLYLYSKTILQSFKKLFPSINQLYCVSFEHMFWIPTIIWHNKVPESQ